MTDSSLKKMWIGGQAVDGDAGVAPLVSVNPATGEVNYEVAAAGAKAADTAVRVADEAARDKKWRNMLPPARAAILSRIADGMERRSEELARLQMIENGKVWRECQTQVKSAAATFRRRGANPHQGDCAQPH